MDDDEYHSVVQYEWILPGATKNVSYALDEILRDEGAFAFVTDFVFHYDDGEEAVVEFTDIKVTDRNFMY